MGWKDKIVDPQATTSSLFGGLTVNNILDYFSAVDLTSGGSLPDENVDIATETIFANEILKLWDSNKSHKIVFQTPDYTETKTWTMPAEGTIGATDEIMFKDAVQIVTGKTLDFTTDNTIQNIPTAALPSSLLYNTDDNNLGAHYLDIADISTPSNPAATIRRIFKSTTTGKLSVIKSDGTVLSLEEGNLSQAGGFAAGGTSTQSGDGSDTTFTIAHGLADPPDIVHVVPTSIDANSSTYQLDKDATNITITYNTAPPSGSSNLIWYWGAAYVNPDPVLFTETSTNTFSNKTIHVDNNIIKDSSTNTQGDVYTYQTDRANRLARGTANQVLAVNTGGTDTVFTTLAKAHIPAAIAYEDEANIFTSSQTLDSFLELKTISTPADPASTYIRLYPKAIVANNDGLFAKTKFNSTIAEVRVF